MDYSTNRIMLRGTLETLPVFSHENHGKEFYMFTLSVPRLSGTEDVLPVIVPHDILTGMDLFGGDMITVIGQIRSFNSRNPAGRKLLIFVYAETIETCHDEPVNQVMLHGALCKDPVFRKTPLGREICDIMLAVNRPYHRCDYMPCILWGSTAHQIAGCTPGTQLTVQGRLQSRSYVKILDSGPEQRIAYEISALSAEICEQPTSYSTEILG